MEGKMHLIRVSNRNLIIRHRRRAREQQNDDQRLIPKIRTSRAEIEEIVNKMKTKSSVTVEELNILKNNLIEDDTCLQFVLNVDGAMKGLVKYLIGSDVKKQCAAAACCCNLTLGDSKSCFAVAKATGPYLVAALDSLTLELAVTCAWSLGNIASAGVRACDTLTAQGAVSKLIEKLRSPLEDLRDAAVYAIIHFVYQLKNELSQDHLTQILRVVPTLEIEETTLYLLYLLSCHRNFVIFELSDVFIQKILHKMNFYLNYYPSEPKLAGSMLYMFRFLGNLNVKIVYDLMLQHFVLYDMVGSIHRILGVYNINQSLLWMLGNMYKLCFDHVFFRQLSSLNMVATPR